MARRSFVSTAFLLSIACHFQLHRLWRMTRRLPITEILYFALPHEVVDKTRASSPAMLPPTARTWCLGLKKGFALLDIVCLLPSLCMRFLLSSVGIASSLGA
jgi:hypothetical protein